MHLVHTAHVKHLKAFAHTRIIVCFELIWYAIRLHGISTDNRPASDTTTTNNAGEPKSKLSRMNGARARARTHLLLLFVRFELPARK